MKWFLKELPNSPVFDRNGKKIPFEVYGGDFGGITVDETVNPELVEDLEKLIKKRAGGVSASTEPGNDSKKSLPVYKPFVSPSDTLAVFQPLRPTLLNPPHNPNDPVAVAEAIAASKPTPTIHPLAAMDLLKGAVPVPITPAAAGGEPPKVDVTVKPRTGRLGRPPGKPAAPAVAA